jgi:hypothetical protein
MGIRPKFLATTSVFRLTLIEEKTMKRQWMILGCALALYCVSSRAQPVPIFPSASVPNGGMPPPPPPSVPRRDLSGVWVSDPVDGKEPMGAGHASH